MFWIIVGIASWCVLAVGVSIAFGRVIARADREQSASSSASVQSTNPSRVGRHLRVVSRDD
jgi:hypothetical protein